MKKVKLMIYLTIALLAIILTGSAWARSEHGGGDHRIHLAGGGHRHNHHAGGGHRHHGHAGGGYRHGRHRHFGHRHNHNRFNFGINLGGSGFYNRGFYGGGLGLYNRSFAGRGYYGYRNYGYRDPFYYPRYNAYPQTVIVPSTPPVYIQQEEVKPAPAQPQTHYWHYCRDPDGYYPYVKKCPGGWLQVAPQPAQ